jgi:hypothetical protein
MSNTAKTNTAADVKVEVPEQQSSDAKSAAVLTIGDALKAVESKKSEGMTVTLTLDENGEVQVQVNELTADGKAKKLVDGAKGLFQRNKKLVVATVGLTAASLVLRAIARRQDGLEADEVIESSDDVAVDA